MIVDKQVRRENNESVLTLTFHGLGTPSRELPPGEDAYWVKPRMFADVLDLDCGRIPAP